jgi:hypothetical protein
MVIIQTEIKIKKLKLIQTNKNKMNKNQLIAEK